MSQSEVQDTLQLIAQANALLDAGYDNGFGVTSLDTLLSEDMDRAARIDFAAHLILTLNELQRQNAKG